MNKLPEWVLPTVVLAILLVIGCVVGVALAIAPNLHSTNAPIQFRVLSNWHTGTFDYNTGAIIGACDAQQCYPLAQIEAYRYE